MIEHATFYLLLDMAAIAATLIMLHVTEKKMQNDKPLPQDFAEAVAGHKHAKQEQRIHAMLNDPNNEEDITTWSVDDIVADLLAYADLDEEETEDVIRKHVITWKANRSHPT